MTEQLVEFSTAKLAKEKGFNEPCIDTFNGKGQEQDRYNLIAEDVLDKDVYLDPDDIRTWFENTNSELEKVGLNWKEYFERNGIDHKAFISRPTQSLLQKWLRKKHGIYVEIISKIINSTLIECVVYIKTLNGEMYSGEKEFHNWKGRDYPTALEDGLYEALKLIP